MPTDRLALPATIPGLLRRGSPAICPWGPCLVLDPAPHEVNDDPDVIVVWATRASDDRSQMRWYKPRNIGLDLSDATGRAHAAWWLADQGWGDGTVDHEHVAGPWSSGDTRETWPTSIYLGDGGFAVASEPQTTGDVWLVVPALAALDPADRTRLADGSLQVDAEALRLVCLHVAGMGVTDGD